MILAAHQPNFMPWSPFFEKMKQSDCFVILHHAQFVKGNFHNRFGLGGKWYTMSTNQSPEPLSSKQYVDPLGDWQKINRRLPAYASVLENFDDGVESSLAKTNIHIIRKAVELLGGDWPTLIMEEKTNLKGTQRLVSLCQELGADTYLSGPSGLQYLDQELFRKNDINLNFVEPSQDKRALIEVLS